MKQKLCFLFALLLIAIAGNAKTSKDVNGDGVTNVSDVTALVNQIIGSGNYSADVCDVNGDGVVNVSDVTALVNFIINGDSGDEFTYETFNVNGVSFDMAEVEGGTFTMGATEEQGSDVSDNEKPAHQVTLSPYYIGKTEVTQELWEAVMGSNPSFFSGNKNRPVENVSWDDCQVFINKLNRLTGKRFRLPTEAEWEYAARGGKKSKGYKYSGSNTIDAVAWYDTNSAGTTHPVASKAPNELGLYDMSGNVWEWCSDWYGKSYYEESPEPNPIGPEIGTLRVKRGGDWYFSANKCRVSFRNSNSQHYQTSENGLRLVLDMPKETFSVNGVDFDMIEVEGGTFTMGATEEQGSSAYDNEKPTHKVTLSSYMIGKTEVTQELWEAVMGKSLSQIASENGKKTYGVGPNYPMYWITWDDCQEFITKLNALTGKSFRLPTEAEWEFAARGGNKSQGYKYSGSNTIDDVAWYSDVSGSTAHPVGTKAPNELGIFDMTGNVWEWCSDWYGEYYSNPQTNPTGPYTGLSRVNRGGGWNLSAGFCRVSHRAMNKQNFRNGNLGLRLVLDMPKETFTVNGVSFNMVKVAGGTFTMGATEEQGNDALNDEKPAHEVTLSSYMIGETEVTQELWEAVMGKSLSQIASENGKETYGVGANYPMYYISWNDCQEFITKLNNLTGKNFRLPTEAEWEYAARGGNKSQGYKYSGSNTIDDVAWYDTNSAGTTHPVATKMPNELGLYDMSGSVLEWCSDWYSSTYYSSSSQNNPTGPASGSYRVFRGGSWDYHAGYCRVSFREYSSPTKRFTFLGLRLAL